MTALTLSYTRIEIGGVCGERSRIFLNFIASEVLRPRSLIPHIKLFKSLTYINQVAHLLQPFAKVKERILSRLLRDISMPSLLCRLET
jgi:hypothetical protein